MSTAYGGEPAGVGSRPLSPRQERVAQRLLTQVGPGSAAFFRDVCRFMAEGPAWPSAVHLVAHLLREVFSSLQSVLEPASSEARDVSDGHKAKVQAILTELGMSDDDLISELWLGLAGHGNPDNLATRAHRDGLGEPRPFNDEFVTFVDKAEQVLDAVLERFEINYFELFGRLDELLAIPQPADAHARALRSRFPRTEAVAQHFFSRATPAWVGPLHRAGFFANPPGPQIDEDAATAQFPAWPPSQFLVRVAMQAPDAVVAAALAIAGTDNIRVNHDLIEIAAVVPAPLSARLVPQVTAALNSRYRLLIPQRAGVLMEHLWRGGQIGPALDLSAALLQDLSAGYGPAATMHGYAYGVILREHVPVLVAGAGLPALGLVCRALEEVAGSEPARTRKDQAEDWSPVWRPDIGGRVQRPDADLRHGLVEAVRDGALSIIDSGLAPVADVVAELESHGRVIFRRMALHVLSRYPALAPELVRQRLTDAAIITDWRLHREYRGLAGKGATCLDPAHTRCLLALIDNGPAARPSDALTGTESQLEGPVDRDRFARWQRNCLAAIQAILPPGWDARYQALVTEFGPAPDPEEPVPGTFAIRVAESPVTAGELAAMPTDGLISFLKAGQLAEDDGNVPSTGSLRGALSSAIQDDAEHRSADAASFIGLPSEYVSAVINGLWQALTHGANLDWEGVVALSMWINQQASEEIAHGQAEADIRWWREPRTDMIRLLIAGLNLEPNPIPARFDTDIWTIITDCCRDPDPTTQREREPVAGPDSRFMSLALTAIRAQALPNGYCQLPLVRTCPHANSCLTCPMFVTTAEFLPQHHAQQRTTLQIIATAEANGHARVAEMNRQVAANLDKIISTLEAGEQDEEAAASAS